MTKTELHRTPGGSFSRLYANMSEQTHLLIAGRTGSGKSVAVNGILHSLLCRKTCNETQLILIDPKRVELSPWKHSPHCIAYAADDLTERVQTLSYAIRIIEKRFAYMEGKQLRKYDGGDVYVIIDELADIMTTQKAQVFPLLQRIGQIGRAARVHLIACTQCPLVQIIPTPLKCNFDAILGLKTRSAQDSRNIIGSPGCESLPQYGQGYYITPQQEKIVDLPLIPETEINRITAYWSDRKNYVV